MKRIVSIVALSWICLTAVAQNNYYQLYTDSAALKNQNDALIKDIETRIQLTEPSFSFNGLSTEISKSFMTGQYRDKPNKIYLNTWQIGGPPMEKFLTEVAGTYESGQDLAAIFFYGYFLPHEVGHALQYHTNHVPASAFDGEYEANELAVAYWRSKGRQEDLQHCYQMAKKVLRKLKDPIPKNVDAKKYVTDHYDELVDDPYKYGYIQFDQIVKVLEDKALPDFDSYIKKYFAK